MNALKLNFGVTSSSSAAAAAIQNKQSKQQQQRPFGSISNLTMLSNDPAVAAANAAQRTKLGVPLPLRKVSSPAYIDLGETAAVVTAPTTPCQTPTSTSIFGGSKFLFYLPTINFIDHWTIPL